MNTSNSVQIVGIAGSLRAKSLNRALLRAAQELRPSGMGIDIFDLNDVPLYNQDVEDGGIPISVLRLRDAIRAAHGLLIVTPEYNHGVPGVTKNTIDWLSRPPRKSVLDGKPVALMGASPGMTGTARGQSQLRQAFEFTNSPAMLEPEILVARASEKFDTAGKLIDEKTRQLIETFLQAFTVWIGHFR
jgi:chromate reductase, NAD(P)H dehydrogenase (quinone)